MPYLLVQREGGDALRVALDRSVLRAGRSASNEIHLSGDPTVSRQHAEFTRDGDRWFVRDTESRSGTRVNGAPIARATEVHRGDRIFIGRTIVHFLHEGDPEPSGPESGHLHEGPSGQPPAQGTGGRGGPPPLPLTSASVTVHLSEIVGSVRAEPGAAPAGLELASRSRAFEILSRLAESFVGRQDLDEVLGMSLDMVQRAASPDRAALMLLEGSPPALKVRAQRGAAAAGESEIRISRTITEAVLRDQQAVLTSDAALDPRFAGIESVILQGVRSALCVPLWNNREVIGLIYADILRPASSYSREDLEVLTLVANLAAIKIENARLYLREQKMKELEREMATAAKIQQRLLPASAPPFDGYELAGRNVPCLAVGGDYFDMQPLDAARLAVAVGDVSGKGLGAALLMAVVQGAFRAHFGDVAGVPDLAFRLNHVVLTNSGDEQFFTLFCGEIDGPAGILRYVNAGHCPALLVRAGGTVERLHSGGMALGILPGIRFAPMEARLEPGDLLALYSDGITEAADAADAEFGEERLTELLRLRREDPLDRLLEAVLDEVRTFAGPAPQHDDMTLVLVRRSGVPRA